MYPAVTFKDEFKIAENKAAEARTDFATSDHDDIARLLRALNEDLRTDPKVVTADSVDEIGDEDEEAGSGRHLPFGKIALALIAAGGIGFAVVMVDSSKPEAPGPSQTATVAPVAAPPLTPNPKPAGGAQPEALIARAPAPGPAPVPAVAPAPVPPPLPSAPGATQTVVKPPEPLPPKAEPAPVKPVEAKAPEAVETKPPEPPKVAEVKAPEAPPAPEIKAPGAETAELQAMLTPKAPPPGGKGQQATPAVQPPAKAARPAVAYGRWVVQAGSFSIAENAEGLRRRLADKGYAAQVIDWTDGAQRSWKVVRVGAPTSQAEARRIAGELTSILGLNTLVVGVR